MRRALLIPVLAFGALGAVAAQPAAAEGPCVVVASDDVCVPGAALTIPNRCAVVNSEDVCLWDRYQNPQLCVPWPTGTGEMLCFYRP